MRDLPRVVADTPVGKQTPVVIIRKGEEQTKTVTLGRLEDGEKLAASNRGIEHSPEKPVVKKTLGIELANISDELRRRYKIKDSVNGIVITGIDASSPAAEKRLSPGDVIVEIAQEAVANIDDFQSKIEKLKRDGRRSALLLVAGDGANDIPMIEAAGLGVAYHAKPKVAACAPARIDHADLTALLYAQGYRREEFVEADDGRQKTNRP